MLTRQNCRLCPVERFGHCGILALFKHNIHHLLVVRTLFTPKKVCVDNAGVFVLTGEVIVELKERAQAVFTESVVDSLIVFTALDSKIRCLKSPLLLVLGFQQLFLPQSYLATVLAWGKCDQFRGLDCTGERKNKHDPYDMWSEMHTRFPIVCYINNITIIINRHIYTCVPDLKILHLTVLLWDTRSLVASPILNLRNTQVTQWPIFVMFLRFVFGLLYGWKIQTWPIIRFLTDSVTYWFFICWYLIESMMPWV